jgi:hypothetical protein
MEATVSSETLVPIYETKLCYIEATCGCLIVTLTREVCEWNFNVLNLFDIYVKNNHLHFMSMYLSCNCNNVDSDTSF